MNHANLSENVLPAMMPAPSSMMIVAASRKISVVARCESNDVSGKLNPSGYIMVLRYTTTALSRYPMAMLKTVSQTRVLNGCFTRLIK